MDNGARSRTLRQKQKLQTRLEIIHSALTLFGEHGFDNVPVESICERAGISRATFFNYFPQKELILSEMALARVERMRGFLQEYSERKRTGSLDDVLTAFLTFAKENESLGGHNRNLFLQVLARPVCYEPQQAVRAQMIAIVTELLDRMKKDGSLKGVKQASSTIAETLFALYLATSLEWFMQKDLPKGWLVKALKRRMQVAVDGIVPKGIR
jgi:AcrR family transcriptional regulator